MNNSSVSSPIQHKAKSIFVNFVTNKQTREQNQTLFFYSSMTLKMGQGHRNWHECVQQKSCSRGIYATALIPHRIRACEMAIWATFLTRQMIHPIFKVKGDPKGRQNLSWGQRKCANTSIHRLRMAVLSVFMQHKYFFCLKSELLRALRCWFALDQWKVEKGWLMMLHTLPPHIPA